MASTRSSSSRPSAIVDATAKTRSVIESLQARLVGDNVRPAGWEETIDDLERQLQACFDRAELVVENEPSAARTPMLDDLRNRVIERVVDRILAEWSNPKPGESESALQRQVLDRLVERVLAEFRRG